ncbi:MAG: GGDEF domain-containing protein [Desulfovibrionaceae bacterium]
MAAKENAGGKSRCDYSERDKMCQVMDEAGVPQEEKWRALILFMRSLRDFDYLSELQRAELQALVMETLKNREFDEDNFQQILQRTEAIISSRCLRKLESAMEEVKLLVQEFQRLLKTRTHEVRQLETFTVETVEQDMDPQEMIARLRNAFHEVVGAMEQDTANLTEMTRTDPLTAINNRRALDEYLQNAVTMAREEQYPLSLLMLDIDHFKNFNDQYGHRIGDQALMTVARIMKKYAQEEQDKGTGDYFIARYGGEEFCVVLPGVDQALAMAIGDELRERIGRYKFVIRSSDGDILHRGIKITISVGAAVMRIEWKGALAENLVEAADKALYTAKNAGRNRVVGYDPDQM